MGGDNYLRVSSGGSRSGRVGVDQAGSHRRCDCNLREMRMDERRDEGERRKSENNLRSLREKREEGERERERDG